MPDLLVSPISISGVGNKVVIPGIEGQSILVVGLYFQCGVATTITVKSGTTEITGPMTFATGGGLQLPFTTVLAYYYCPPGEDLIFGCTGLTGSAGGQIWYFQYDETP